MITKALIENFRETVKPVVSQLLFGVNYEGMGTHDCEEFERDFDEILDLALVGYEQKVNKAVSTLDGNKNDMVYRQQAIAAVRASYDEILDFKSTGRTVADSVEDILSELPAVYAVPNKGEWIEIRRKRTGEVIALRCNKCLRHPKHAVRTDFCPHCGADMR